MYKYMRGTPGDGFRALGRGVVLQVQRVRAPAGHRGAGQAAADMGHAGRVRHVPGTRTHTHTHAYLCTNVRTYIHTHNYMHAYILVM